MLLQLTNGTVNATLESDDSSYGDSSSYSESSGSSEPQYGSDDYVERWDQSQQDNDNWAYLHDQPVKTYKTVYMRVYATISYVGEYDYVTGQHAFFPWVSFDAKKSGYSDRYLNGYLLTSY